MGNPGPLPTPGGSMGHGKMLRSSKILLHVYSLNLSVICVKDIFNVPGGIFILYISSLTLIDRFARSKPFYGDLKQTKADLLDESG